MELKKLLDILPLIIMIESFLASIPLAIYSRWGSALYWFAAGLLNLAVIFGISRISGEYMKQIDGADDKVMIIRDTGQLMADTYAQLTEVKPLIKRYLKDPMWKSSVGGGI